MSNLFNINFFYPKRFKYLFSGRGRGKRKKERKRDRVRERQTDNRERERGDKEGQEKKMRHILDYNNKNFLIYF